MASNRFDEVRDYDFADRALALRQRAGLTQGELAALMGVGVRSIQAWEAAVSYPGADRLQQMIAVHLEHGGFAVGHEMEEASAPVGSRADVRAAAHHPLRPAPVRVAPEHDDRDHLRRCPIHQRAVGAPRRLARRSGLGALPRSNR